MQNETTEQTDGQTVSRREQRIVRCGYLQEQDKFNRRLMDVKRIADLMQPHLREQAEYADNSLDGEPDSDIIITATDAFQILSVFSLIQSMTTEST